MRIALPFVVSVLSACQPVLQSTPESTPVPQPTPSVSVAGVTNLEGHWRVAGIDGAEFNEPYGLALTGSTRELWWEPRCARLVRSYRITGGTIAFGPALDAPKAHDPPVPICLIAPPSAMGAVLRALDGATQVSRTSQNGVLIAGGGHSVLLFSQ